ncbi:UNVERIFIED_CONTAM: hypothetical protein Sradi_2972300 [Sesamum radiatum]|uniref:Uncharacterized protein n=1 Tax=Sesamum radiatum TaxID=300843 RepID=A0AAW2RZV5_SESRA
MSGYLMKIKDSCNAEHGDDTTSNEDTLLEKEDSSDADDYISTITFSDEDLLLSFNPHNRPLFVVRYVLEQKVNRILIDEGSTVNILPLRTLKKLGVPMDELSTRDKILNISQAKGFKLFKSSLEISKFDLEDSKFSTIASFSGVVFSSVAMSSSIS